MMCISSEKRIIFLVLYRIKQLQHLYLQNMSCKLTTNNVLVALRPLVRSYFKNMRTSFGKRTASIKMRYRQHAERSTFVLVTVQHSIKTCYPPLDNTNQEKQLVRNRCVDSNTAILYLKKYDALTLRYAHHINFDVDKY
jgi:hypothetical protein